MADSSTEVTSEAPATDTVVDAGSTTAPVVNQAEPTPAKEPSSVLDAVSKALSPDKGVEAAPPAAVNRSPEGDPNPKENSSAEPADLSEQEMKQLAPKTQERMRFLANQRTDLQTQVDDLKPKAEGHERLTGFLRQHNISSDEANNALELTRLIKSGNYADAKKMLDPIYSELQKRAGDVLDTDLAEEVRLGTTPHERALEIQRARAEAISRRTQDHITEERRTAEERETSWKNHVGSVAKAADDWAKDQAKSDPDWALKSDDVVKEVELDLRRNGFPKTPAEVIERSKTALATVEAKLKRLRPAQVEIKPNLGNGSRSSTSSTTKPKSALDAVNMSLGE